MASILEDRTAKANQAINTTSSPMTDAKSATGVSAFRRPPPLVAATTAPSAPPAAPATGVTSPTVRTTSPVMRHNPYGMPQTSDRATSPTMPLGVAAGNMSPNNANTYANGFGGMVGRSPSPPNAATTTGSAVTDSTSNRPYSSAYSRGTSPLHQHPSNNGSLHYGAIHRGSYTDAMQRNIHNAANASNTSFGFSTSSPTTVNPQASTAHNASNHPTNTSATNNVAFTFNSARIASGSVSPLSFAQAAAELNFTEEVEVSPQLTNNATNAGPNKQQQNTSTLSDTPSRSSITKVYQNGRPMVRSSTNNSTNTSALSEHHMTQLGAAATVIMSADTDEISFAPHSNVTSPAAPQQQQRTTSPLTATTYLHGQQPQLRRSPHVVNQFVNPNATESASTPTAAAHETAAAAVTAPTAAPLPDLIVVNVAFRRSTQLYIVRRASQLLGITTEPMLTGAHVMVEGDRGIDMGRITGIDCLASKELVAAAASASPAEFNTLMTSPSSTVEPSANGNAANAYNNANSRPRPVCRLAKYPFVIRNATQEEVNNYHNVQVLEEARACQYAADQAARNIPEGVEIVDCTFQYDRNKLTLWYVAAERVYFVPLLKVLNQRYRCRIWMERVMPPATSSTSPTAAMPTNQFHNSVSEVPQAASSSHYDPHHASVTEFADMSGQPNDTPSRGGAYAANTFGTNNNRRRNNNNGYPSSEATPSTNMKASMNSNMKNSAAPSSMDKKSDATMMPHHGNKNTLTTGSNNRQQQQHSYQGQGQNTTYSNSSRRGQNNTHQQANAGGNSATKKRLTFDD